MEDVDDTQLHRAFSQQLNAFQQLNFDLALIDNLSEEHNLLLNPSKSKASIFCKRKDRADFERVVNSKLRVYNTL